MIILSYIRDIKGITLQEVADKCGITKQNVNAWEKGSRPIPQKYLPILSNMLETPESILTKPYLLEDVKAITISFKDGFVLELS